MALTQKQKNKRKETRKRARHNAGKQGLLDPIPQVPASVVNAFVSLLSSSASQDVLFEEMLGLATSHSYDEVVLAIRYYLMGLTKAPYRSALDKWNPCASRNASQNFLELVMHATRQRRLYQCNLRKDVSFVQAFCAYYCIVQKGLRTGYALGAGDRVEVVVYHTVDKGFLVLPTLQKNGLHTALFAAVPERYHHYAELPKTGDVSALCTFHRAHDYGAQIHSGHKVKALESNNAERRKSMPEHLVRSSVFAAESLPYRLQELAESYGADDVAGLLEAVCDCLSNFLPSPYRDLLSGYVLRAEGGHGCINRQKMQVLLYVLFSAWQTHCTQENDMGVDFKGLFRFVLLWALWEEKCLAAGFTMNDAGEARVAVWASGSKGFGALVFEDATLHLMLQDLAETFYFPYAYHVDDEADFAGALTDHATVLSLVQDYVSAQETGYSIKQKVAALRTCVSGRLMCRLTRSLKASVVA